MIRVMLPKLAQGASIADTHMRNLTHVFGKGSSSSLYDTNVVRNRELGGAYCQVSGIWFPNSQLRIDGLGRKVGAPFATRKPPTWR